MTVHAILNRWTLRSVLLLVIAAGFCSGPAPRSSATSAMQAVVVLNAASFASDNVVTPNTIVAAFGQFKSLNNQTYPAQTVPLPTVLGGVSVKVNGIAAALMIVTPLQINLVIPAGVGLGPATLIVTNSDATTLSGNVTVVQSQPGIFTAASNGTGAAAAQTTFDGITYEFTANPDASPRPISAGTKDRPNFLILYGTGLGSVPLSLVKVTILGVPCRVDYAGPQGAFAGLDQFNVRIPWELGGLGVVNLVVTIALPNDVRTANVTQINLGGTIPPILAFPITPGSTVDGDLTYEDQVQTSGDNVYFFDAYIFQTTQPNVTVALDLQSPKVGTTTGPVFDALLLVYRLDGNELTFVAQNDQTGGIGNGEVDVNNNALLLSVLQQAGQYVVLVTTYDGEPLGIGSYTLNFKANVIQKINYGQTVNGNITASSIKTSAGVYLDAWYFDATQGDRIRAIMRSTAFDSFLFLYRNYTDPDIAYNDNGAGGMDAQVDFTITETKPHLLLATPFALNDTGAYTLQLTKLAALTGTEPAGIPAPPSLPERFARLPEDPRRPGVPVDRQGSSFDRAGQRRFVIR